MHAMRRHAHNLLAALLCMCLLVSYTPLPASAVEGGYSPSVSDELDAAKPNGDGTSQMSTTVSVLTIPALAITGKTEDYAARIDEIKADSEKYDLKVAATGQAPLAYSWTRTVEGAPDDGFSFEGGAVYPLSQHADTLEDGKTYVYTVVVSDQSGASVSTDITVVVSSAYAQRTFEDKGRDIVVTANAHYAVVLSTDAVDAATATYAALQEAAGGATMAGAWQVDLTGAPEGYVPFLGSASVSLSTAGIPAGAEVFVVGLDASGKVSTYEAAVRDGKAVFDTAALGAFAVAWKLPSKPSFTIEASVEGGNGQIDPSGSLEVAESDSATFRFLPDEGYVVDVVKVDGVAVATDEIAGNSYTFQNVAGDHRIAVSFKKIEPQPTLRTVSARVEGGHGEVSVQGGQPASSAQAQVQEGASATVAFLPESGYVVDTVTMKTGEGHPMPVQPTSPNELVVSAVTDDVEVTVTYKPGSEIPVQKHTVTATATPAEGGSIEPGSVEVAHGGSTELTVRANAGYRLKELTVDGEDATGKLDGSTLKVENVVSDRTVLAVFEPVAAARHTVTASAGEGGSISPSGSQEASEGSSLTFYLHPDEGHRLKSLMLAEDGGAAVDVTDRVAGGVFVLDDIRADCALTASFEESGIVVPEDACYLVSASAGEGGSISPSGSVRVKAGGSQTFHFLPDEGFALSSVEVNGQPVAVLGLSYTLGAIMANASIAATFEPVGEGPAPDVPQVHSIEATSTAGGTVSPSGSVQVPHGGSMSFAFIPYAGYELDEVHVDGQPHAEAAEKGMHRFDNVVHDEHAVHAVFKAKTAGPDDPVVTATAGAGGSISPAGAVRVARGASQTFSFIPDAGFAVDSVTVNGSTFAFSDASYTLADVQDDTEVHVEFKEQQGAVPPKTHTVSASATAGGEIAPEGDVSVADGAALTLSFAPFAGYQLHRVVVDGADLAPDQLAKGYHRFADVRENHSIRAYFALEGTDPGEGDPDQPTGYIMIDASAGEGGSIDPSGQVKVPLGTDQAFQFKPQEGYKLDQVLVNGQPVEVQGLTYELQNVRAKASIRATFKESDKPAPKVHAITATATSGGSIDPAGRVVVDEGASKTFAIEADAGFELSHLLIDGETVEASAAANGAYTFSDVRSDHAIRAVFRPAGSVPVEPSYAVVHALADEGGTISPAGDVRVEKGGSVSFVMLPYDGYRLADVTLDGNSVMGRVQEGCRLVLDGVDAEATVVASFAPLDGDPAPDLPETHVVRATSTSGGTIAPRGTVAVIDDDRASFAVMPDEGYVLAKLVIDGVDAPADLAADGTFTFENVKADRSVHAVFERVPGGPAPVEPPYVNVDVEVKVKVSAESASNGGGAVQPDFVSVPRGTRNLPFYVYPDEGHVLESVTVNGVEMDFHALGGEGAGTLDGCASVFAASAPGAAGACWFMVDEAQEDIVIEVTFRKLAEGEEGPAPVRMHRVEASASAGGSISPSGASYVPDGGQAMFSVRPDAGFRLASLMVDENGVEREAKDELSNGLLSLSDVRGAATVRATFEPEAPGPDQPAYVTVHASAGEHGAVSPSGDVRVKRGGSQTFSFVPESGYTLDKVLVGGSEVAAEGSSLMLTDLVADTEVHATFRPMSDGEPIPVFHDVVVSHGAHGRVWPSGVVQVEEGKSLSLLLVPDAGYEVAGVKVNGVDVSRDAWADGSFAVENVTGPTRVEVAFAEASQPAPGKVRVTAEAGEGGSISPSGTFEVDEGSTIDFSLIPDADFAVERVTVNGHAVAFEGTSYRLFEVAEDTTLRVTFKEDAGATPAVTHVITAVAGLHGSIAPSGACKVVQGDSQLFQFKPHRGFEVDAVLVDGVRVQDPGTSYLFENVEGDHRIEVTFRVEGFDPAPPDTDDEPAIFSISAGVSGGHGRISPEGAVPVERGKSRTFQFLPDAGYQVSALIIDGEKRSFNADSYRFVDVQANHAIEVEFSAAVAPAPATPVDAVSRAAQKAVGYVKTGDANGLLLASVLALAAAASATAVLSRRRASRADAASARGGRGSRR